MKNYFIIAALVIFFAVIFILHSTPIESAMKPETRCGWFSNPTPANAWLTDAQGDWLISLQGAGWLVDGWPPEFKTGQWVETNGHYGYGCACMKVKVIGPPEGDKAAGRIIKIFSSYPKPLSSCRKDKTLRGKEPG